VYDVVTNCHFIIDWSLGVACAWDDGIGVVKGDLIWSNNDEIPCVDLDV
jgi:hypothetical protein